MALPELFASTDGEMDGPVPLRNSMLSLGTVVFTLEKQVIASFYRNIRPLHDAAEDPSTMKWWSEHPEAYAATHVDQRDAREAMQDFVDWCADLARQGDLTFMAYPGLFDGMFVRTYVKCFSNGDPFDHRGGWCIRNVAATHLRIPFHAASEERFPKHWLDGAFPLNHNSLDDAASQGATGINAIRASRGLPHIPTVTLRCGYRPPGFGTEALANWIAA